LYAVAHHISFYVFKLYCVKTSNDCRSLLPLLFEVLRKHVTVVS